MKQIMNVVAQYIANVPDQIRKIRLLLLLVFAVSTLVFFNGISKLKFDFTIERWLEHDNAAFVAYNEFHEQFGSEDGVVIVYKPKDGDVFSVKSLEVAKGILDDLTYYRADLEEGEASALDHIVNVDSLINAFLLVVEDDTLRSTSLVGETVPTSFSALDKIKKTALSQKDFPLKYFSKDMKYGAIYIDTDFGAIPVDSDGQPVEEIDIDMLAEDLTLESDSEKKETPKFKPTDIADYIALHAALNNILNKPEYTEHLEYYKVGNTIDSENQVKMGKEMAVLYMVALVIMLILLFTVFRSFSGILWPLSIILLTAIWTLGIAGILGLSASPFIILTILLILAIGMADAVHIISNYLFFRNEEYDHQSALRSAYEKAGVACLLTSITTVVGLLSLCLTDLVPIRNFALMSAMSVAIAFLLTLYLLPILLDFWSPVPKNRKDRENILARVINRITPNIVPFVQRNLDKVVPAVEKRPIAFIAPFIIVFVICVYGAFQVRIDYSIYDQYSEDSNFYQSIKLLDDEMAGSSRISLYMDLGQKNALHDPVVMNVIDDLQRKLEREYPKYVITTSSIVEVVKDANKKLNEGREEMYLIPSNERELSQTLFMFNIADPEERGRLVSEDYRKANVTVTLRTYGSYEYRPVFERMKKDINESLDQIKRKYPAASISITGLFAIGMQTADYIIITELQSFGTALIVISAILLVIFSSIKGGLISLVPNLIPSFSALGLLGLLGIPLDFYTMILAPIVIGISVDDTVHFLTHYRSEVMKDADIKRALRATIKECGQAIVFTTMILGFGFGIMSIATTPGLQNLGKFGLLAVFAGLISDLFLLPALIIVTKLKFVYQKVAYREAT